ATVTDVSYGALRNRDLVPFAALGNKAGAIMIGHGTYPQIDAPDLPATLSRRITTDLLRNSAGFNGLAITDDMEMHAVSDFGSYETITERALLAGNDVVMFCSHIERIPDIQRFLGVRVKEDAGFRRRAEQASGRAAAYGQHGEQWRRDAGSGESRLEEVAGGAARFVEEFQKTRGGAAVAGEADRRKDPRTPGTGRTGREEWT